MLPTMWYQIFVHKLLSYRSSQFFFVPAAFHSRREH